MRPSRLLATAGLLPSALAVVYKGFNSGATFSNGAVKVQQDYENEFSAARNLQYTANTFTSARLYTMIQGGTTNSPIEAIPAAIATQTTLLLGLWASAGQASFDNEVAALTNAIDQYGTAFTDLVAGISVGSEDIYRTTELGIASNAGPGVTADQIVAYVGQVRSAIANTPASALPVGHVDTYNVYTNGSNAAVIPALDFLGVDAYPYYQTTVDNSIGSAHDVFFQALDDTQAASQGKPIWITETGWPWAGPQSGAAVASVDNAATYYNQVGCYLFSHGYNTWWFVLQDQEPTFPAAGISFAVTGAGNPPPTTPLYSLAC